MNGSRMNRYNVEKLTGTSRVNKNKKLYEEVSDIDVDYIDIDVNNVLEIEEKDLTKSNRSTYQKRKELENIISVKEEQKIYEEIPIRKNRIYDIDEILKKAKEAAKEEQKKHLSTEYNILTKLDIDDIDKRDLKEDEIKEIVENTYPKKEIDDNKDLFSDMMESEDEKLEKTVKEVLEETTKNDDLIMENEESLNNSKDTEKKEIDDNLTEENTTQIIENEKKSKKMLIFIIIVVIILLALAGYLFLNYFGTL